MATRVWDTAVGTSSHVAFGTEQSACTGVVTDLERSTSIRPTPDMHHTAEGQPSPSESLPETFTLPLAPGVVPMMDSV